MPEPRAKTSIATVAEAFETMLIVVPIPEFE
jgi:hypothetical protein